MLTVAVTGVCGVWCWKLLASPPKRFSAMYGPTPVVKTLLEIEPKRLSTPMSSRVFFVTCCESEAFA